MNSLWKISNILSRGDSMGTGVGRNTRREAGRDVNIYRRHAHVQDPDSLLSCEKLTGLYSVRNRKLM